MIIEALITFIIVAALFYVAPGVLGSVKTAAPIVCGDQNCANATGMGYDASLNATQVGISTSVSGGLSLSSITMIMMGIAIMIGGFMLVRGGRE